MTGRGGARRAARERTRSAVLPLVACCMVLMVAFAALAVDTVAAYRARSAQQQTLELAKDNVMNRLNSIKYGDYPFDEIIESVKGTLAADGFDGTAEIACAEEPQAATGATNRLIGVYVKLTGSTETTLARAIGKDRIDVASEICWTINPYSDTEVWRPSTYRTSTSSYNSPYYKKYGFIYMRNLAFSSGSCSTDAYAGRYSMSTAALFNSRLTNLGLASLKSALDDGLKKLR